MSKTMQEWKDKIGITPIISGEILPADWEGIEQSIQEERDEAEWIKQIRDYCKETSTFPSALIHAHKESKLPLYVFMYCDNTWEAGPTPLSYHRSKKAAYKAMKEHKMREFYEYLTPNRKQLRKHHKFGLFEHWHIEQVIIEE